MKHLVFGLFLGIVLGMVGCATARVESMEPGKGGVIAYSPPGNADAKQKAMMLAQSNCGARQVKIEKEGYVIVGQRTYESGNQEEYKRRSRYGRSGRKSTYSSSSSTTTDIKEWRMTYSCLGG